MHEVVVRVIRANSKIPDQDGASCLHAAVGTATDEATIPLLVKHKVDLNFQNPKTGNTALHLAVKSKRPRIILFLLEKGASIDISNNEGLTPLQLAANTDNCEAISLLLQRCAHVEARSLLVLQLCSTLLGKEIGLPLICFL